jgi:hypothetical protein
VLCPESDISRARNRWSVGAMVHIPRPGRNEFEQVGEAPEPGSQLLHSAHRSAPTRLVLRAIGRDPEARRHKDIARFSHWGAIGSRRPAAWHHRAAVGAAEQLCDARKPLKPNG